MGQPPELGFLRRFRKRGDPMSERFTTVTLPGLRGGYGWSDRGRVPAREIIAAFRRLAAEDLAAAQAVLAASDDDFLVTTEIGVHVRRRQEIIQPGRPGVGS